MRAGFLVPVDCGCRTAENLPSIFPANCWLRSSIVAVSLSLCGIWNQVEFGNAFKSGGRWTRNESETISASYTRSYKTTTGEDRTFFGQRADSPGIPIYVLAGTVLRLPRSLISLSPTPFPLSWWTLEKVKAEPRVDAMKRTVRGWRGKRRKEGGPLSHFVFRGRAP